MPCLVRIKRIIKEQWDYEEDDTEEIVQKQLNCVIEEVPTVLKMFEWAGISFGDQEAYRVNKAIKRLAKVSGATKMRFWGKYLARNRDYFVLEGELPYKEEAKTPKGVEPRGKGVNSHVYWVTDDLLSDWIQLPDAEPRYILAARNVKCILTGNLNADLNTNPKFPGKERHYLRAQIARISHSTTIIPKDFMVPHEENDKELVYNEEFAGISKNAIEMNNLESWGYAYQNILLAGTAEHDVSHIVEEEREEALAQLEEKDPFIERLKGIGEDKKVYKELDGGWTTKIVGNQQQYASGEGNLSYA